MNLWILRLCVASALFFVLMTGIRASAAERILKPITSELNAALLTGVNTLNQLEYVTPTIGNLRNLSAKIVHLKFLYEDIEDTALLILTDESSDTTLVYVYDLDLAFSVVSDDIQIKTIEEEKSPKSLLTFSLITSARKIQYTVLIPLKPDGVGLAGSALKLRLPESLTKSKSAH